MRHPHRIVATDGVREPDLVKRRFAASAHGLDKIDTFTEGTPWGRGHRHPLLSYCNSIAFEYTLHPARCGGDRLGGKGSLMSELLRAFGTALADMVVPAHAFKLRRVLHLGAQIAQLLACPGPCPGPDGFDRADALTWPP